MVHCNGVNRTGITAICRLITTSYFINFGIPVASFAQCDLRLPGPTARHFGINYFLALHKTVWSFYTYGVSLVWRSNYFRWSFRHLFLSGALLYAPHAFQSARFPDYDSHCDAWMRSFLSESAACAPRLGLFCQNCPSLYFPKRGCTP